MYGQYPNGKQENLWLNETIFNIYLHGLQVCFQATAVVNIGHTDHITEKYKKGKNKKAMYDTVKQYPNMF